MTVYVNNEPRELPGPSTLHQLLTDCRLPSPRGTAIAVNSQVIARAAWDTHSLQPGDKIILIRASQGG